jgi:dGTPase
MSARSPQPLHPLRRTRLAAVRATNLSHVPELAGAVAHSFEERVREHEETWLSARAIRSYKHGGRMHPEAECRVRTPFQRDRDRILHSKAFRRLKGKTQVFIDPAGDHYRTRMTHTLETTAIARGAARALRLNEDLTEAIGLGHDMGHPPFGHAGEAALDESLGERFGLRFRHNEQSLRIAESLNLTAEVRGGILTHTGPREPETLEAKIVRLVDRVAYINHDIDDAIRFGILAPDDLPAEEVALLGPSGARRIDTLVHDLVETSDRAGDIVQSEAIGAAMSSLRSFMFERVYLGPKTQEQHDQARAVVQRIFVHLADRGEEPQAIVDYVSGMTDRFALTYAESLEEGPARKMDQDA